MRIGWSIPLPGPFRVSGTVWRSGRRGYHGTLPGWKCPHNHSRMDLAVACANRYARNPEYQAQQTAPSSVYDRRFYSRQHPQSEVPQPPRPPRSRRHKLISAGVLAALVIVLIVALASAHGIN